MSKQGPVRFVIVPIAALPVAAGIGVVSGAWTAWSEIAAQRYGDQGFSRSAFLVARAALREGADWGVELGVAAAVVLALLAAVLAVCGVRADAEGAVRMLRSRSAVPWLSAAIAFASTAALFLIEREREWLGAAELTHALLVTAAGTVALACLARYARDPRTEADAGRRATVVASLRALAVLGVGGFWINRELLSHPRDPETWTFDGVLLFVAAVTFTWSRSRVAAELAGRRTSAWTGPLAAFSFAGAALGIAACGAGSLEPSCGAPTLEARKPRNVVMIAIDTLRADATSLSGASRNGRDTTPNLRRLAARGVAFSNAVSQAPWTMPSFASVLTGKYPHEHGAYSLTGALRESEISLAEVLREAGYATHGVVSHAYLAERHGFPQGFDTYDASNALGHRAITSKAVTDLSIEALERSGDAPFFLFAHYFDAHYEYMDQPEQPWADSYRGWLREELDYDNLLKNRHLLGPEDDRWLVDLYEEEVAHVDREIGRLIDWLGARGLADDTVFVVVADHGEEFRDHESFGHSTTLYEEQLHVPLIVVAPGGPAGETVDEVVETRAVFGTVLDVLDLDFAAAARARSLLRPQGGAEAGKAFSIVWLPDSKLEWGKHVRLSSLRDGRWKLIRDYTRDRTMLFDLESDPRELRDLSGEQSEIAARMRAVLETWTNEQQNRGGEATTVSIDPEQARMLKELGYL
jgi:arylsulfatase A-like enzyme